MFFPGVLRAPANLANVADLGEILPFPGQGLPVLPSMDLESLTDAVRSLVPPDALVVGESLGGLIALGLPNPVIAIDPPLNMARQSGVRTSLMRTVRTANKPALTDLAYQVFGFSLDGPDRAIDYYSLLRRSSRTVIVSASLRGGLAGSTLDATDYAEIEAAGCELVGIAGPHNLIEVNPEPVRRLILQVRDAVEVVLEPDVAG